MENKIRSIISESISVKQQFLENELLVSTLKQIVDVTVDALKKGNRLWFCGNGGSAADAQHLAAEFSGRFYIDRRALPAEALHCNTSYLTAVANDYGYDEVYARLVEGICNPGDILFGFSTSGNSKNICNAFEIANQKEIITVGFTGDGGGQMKGMSNFLINVPSSNTPRIQEAHILAGHIICQFAEELFFQEP